MIRSLYNLARDGYLKKSGILKGKLARMSKNSDPKQLNPKNVLKDDFLDKSFIDHAKYMSAKEEPITCTEIGTFITTLSVANSAQEHYSYSQGPP